MLDANHQSALAIFAHPGHELRALHALQALNARLIYLTDASAGTGESRLGLSDATLQGAHLARLSGLEPLPDAHVYAALADQDSALLHTILGTLTGLISQERPHLVITDSAEGYNPAHDLCHFLVLAAAAQAGCGSVFEIALNHDPADFRHARPEDCHVFDLDPAAQASKLAVIKDYTIRAGPVLRREAVGLLSRYGEAGQAREILRPALGLRDYLNQFSDEAPFFEQHGRKRVAQGKYASALTLNDHLRPVLERICEPACVS